MNGRTSIGVLICQRHLRGPFESRVEVIRLEDVEPAEMLLGLGAGAVGRLDAPFGRSNDPGLRRLEQTTAEHQSVRDAHVALDGVDEGKAATHLLVGHGLTRLVI
jgi:hypothetical protein